MWQRLWIKAMEKKWQNSIDDRKEDCDLYNDVDTC